MKKRFLLPWQKRYTIVCPKCGGKIETSPLWFWQKKADKLSELQPHFCHAIDLGFLEKIPSLTENDWKSKQKWDAFLKEFTDDSGRPKPREELKLLFAIKNGLPEIFSKYGIFALIQFFTETELRVLFLLLVIDTNMVAKQTYFRGAMDVSTSHVSTILKKYRGWRLIEAWTVPVKGRAHGRQRGYKMADEALKILDQDMQNYDFFREAVIETVTPITEKFPTWYWRKDLVKPKG